MTLVRLIVSLAAVLLLSDSSFGQQPPRAPRSFEDAFGPTSLDLERPYRIDLTSSIYEAPDDDTVLGTGEDLSNQLYTGATVAFAMSRQSRRRRLALNLGTAGRFYPQLGELVTMRHSAAVGLDTSPGKDWRLQLSGSGSFSPLYQMAFGPSVETGSEVQYPVEDFAVSRQRAMQYGSMIGLTRTYSGKTDLRVNYDAHYTQLLGSPDAPVVGSRDREAQALSDYYAQRAGFLVSHSLTQSFGVQAGYGYAVATGVRGPTAVPIRNNDIDLGITYGRALTASGRTSFTMSTGSTIVSSVDGRQFRVIGSGRLITRLTPRWTAILALERGLQTPDGATRPFLSNRVGGQITGYLNRRVAVHAQPTFARGTVGLAGETNAYTSYAGSTRLDIALNRRLALFTEHVVYRYQFANGTVGLPSQLMSEVNRQTVRVGLTLWTPLGR